MFVFSDLWKGVGNLSIAGGFPMRSVREADGVERCPLLTKMLVAGLTVVLVQKVAFHDK